MTSRNLAVSSMLILTSFVVATILVAIFNPFAVGFFTAGVVFAEIAGFTALFLVAATGVMMLFRKSLLRSTRNPDALKDLHVLLAALGGFFLIIHIAFFLLSPLTLPVLVGYLGSYVAFVVWVTGAIFLEGYRASLFYHGLLSLIGVSVIIVHVIGAGRDIPVLFSGITLLAVATVVFIGTLQPLARLSAERTARSVS